VRAWAPRAVAPTDRSLRTSIDPLILPASDIAHMGVRGVLRFAASPESLLKERFEVPEQHYGRLVRLGCLKND
jgi:hypothetical protein